ncbi:lycopene beta-cyclase CrtY [Neorhizobium sp. NPDC001467]|uniref:lycopene beta-cyclase CrtY n=1 Tax=Neorhizobium sp. NPDC001467 TaxID=3390595 RepID=UPI003D040B86
MAETALPLVLIGAGLASALIAKRMSHQDAELPILILEQHDTPFGNHTWSFHDADVDRADMQWLRPMIAHHWDGQSVRFRGHERHLPSGYASLTSGSVLGAMKGLANVTIRGGMTASSVQPDGVILSDGRVQACSCVIDCRGYRPSAALVLGFQKFLGLEVELSEPHGLIDPVIMDATVDQLDGYRFVYLLPLSPTRLLIEDTRYSDGGELDDEALTADIAAYASDKGWHIVEELRRERGVLPIALAHDLEKFWSELPTDIPQAGMRAALFHPTTGYSLPDAVKVANLVAESWPIGSVALAEKIRIHAADQHRKHIFYRLLNRMLFRAARPDRRHLVLERFYKLPTPLIERFYAGRTHARDIARILIGKPPVPLHRALMCLREASLIKRRPHA